MTDQARVVRIVLVVAVIILAGCGNAADQPQQSPGTEATPSPLSPTETDATTAGTLEIHYINVGQSVATLLIAPSGETMLIDTGHFRDDGEHVLAYLREHDIQRIDHLVTSHNDADHIGGNAAVIEYYETQANGVGAVYDPGIAASTQTYNEYLDAVEQHGVDLFEVRDGDRIPFGDVSVRVLAPPENYLANRERNENSIVLKIDHGQFDMLTTGDAEDDGEQYLVAQHRRRIEADLLKAGHHGSSTSTGGQLLDAATPDIVAISSAYDSQYGHPTEAVLQRLAARDIDTYWTGVHGDIVFRTNGRQLTVATQRGATTNPTALRSASPIAPGEGGDVVVRRTYQLASDDAAPITATPPATGESPPSDSSLAIAEIHADAEGDDRQNLNDEYIVVTNTGDTMLDLSGWTISDSANHRFTIPDGVTLGPGEQLTIRTGTGETTSTTLYWGASSPVWNNAGDTITVQTAGGQTVLEEAYP